MDHEIDPTDLDIKQCIVRDQSAIRKIRFNLTSS